MTVLQTRSTIRTAQGPAALAVLVPLFSGCGANGEPPASAAERVEILKTESPLRDPVWVQGEEELLALQEHGTRLVQLDPNTGETLRSVSVGVAGENMDLDDLSTDELFVPQPDRNRVAQISTETLREERGFEAGEDPAWVAVHPGSDTLFALSGDGAAVTGVSLEDGKKVSVTPVDSGPGAFVEPAEDSLEPAFWVAGPEGIAHYAGSPPRRTVGLRRPVSGEAFAGDPEATQRAYVGEPGRVSMVEGDPRGLLEGGLRVVRRTRVDGTPEYVEDRAKEELRVYVATGERLLVLKSDTLQILDSVDFRRPLQGSLGEAKLSGMAVGEGAVYLTFAGETYVVSVKKRA